MAVSQTLTLTQGEIFEDLNASDVRIVWKSTQSGESWNGYTRTAKYWISRNGEAETEHTVSYTLPKGTTVTILDITILVYHKNDGSGSVTVRTEMDTDISAGEITQTKYLDLTIIPRESTLNYVYGTEFDDSMEYQFTPRNTAYYHRLEIALKDNGSLYPVKTIDIGRYAAGRKSFDLTDKLSSIYTTFLKSKKSCGVRFTLYTYTDSGYSNQIPKTSYIEGTRSIPNDTTTQPTMTMTLSPDSAFTSSEKIYVKGLSKVKAVFTDGTGKYGATIASYKLSVSGKDYASPFTSDYLGAAGSVTVKGTVTDSRGFSRTYEQTITVVDYANPSLDTLTCSTKYFTGGLTFKYTPPNNKFYSRCIITLDGETIKTVNLGQKSSGQQTETVTFGETELSDIYYKLPRSAVGVIRFTFRTYGDSGYTSTNQIGADSYKEISLNIPDIDATKPTAALSVSSDSLLDSPFNTLYIKGKSRARAILADGEGKYGADIEAYTVTIGSKSGQSPLTSDYFTTAGDVTVKGIVIDSRGFSRTYTHTIKVIDYSSPRILPISGKSEVVAARCNSEGALDDNGTYLLIQAKRDYSKVESEGTQKNFCKIQYRHQVEGGSYSSWVDILSGTDASDEITTGPLLEGELSTTSTYRVQVRAIDDLGEAGTTNIFISTEKVYMHEAASRNSLGIGKYAEDDNVVDIAEDITTIIRGEVEFKSEAWVSRALGTGVAASTVNSGRWGGTGVYYRVCAGGKHIYVAFNVSFTTKTSTVRADSETIPSAYRPNYDVYALCPVGFSDGSRGIATVSVSPSGKVNIYAVHKLPGAVLSSGETVSWIDGYIDFWT